MKQNNSCTAKVCYHQYPTRVTNGSNYKELTTYDAVRSGKLKPTDNGYPTCVKFEDYRMCVTKGTTF